MPIRCEIVSQDRIVFQGDVDMALLPGVDGVLGVLPNHSPVLTVLKYGIIDLRIKGEPHLFTVAGGFAEVQPDQITILADAAENVEEIDLQRAEAARKRAEEYLQKAPPADTDAYLKIQASLRRSTLRIDAVRRYRQGQRARGNQS